MKRKNVLSIIFLTLLSCILVFHKFNQIPRTLTYDEVEFAELALILARSPFTVFTTFADGHTTLYFYVILLFFKLFGLSSLVLRLPSAISGVLSIVVFYLIARIIFTKKTIISIPLLLSIILLTSHWYFNFARFSFEVPFLLLLELLSALFFIRYYKYDKERDVFLSGIFAGLAFNSYQPGRIFFLLPLLFLINDRKPFRKIAVYIGTFIIITAPLVTNWIAHPGQDIRIYQQMYFRNNELLPSEKITYLGENIKKTALMFGVKGDLNGRHNYPGKPALNPLLFTLFSGGLILAFRNFKDFYSQFFIIYFLFALAPTLLTYPVENPSMLRTFTVLPSVVYFIGLSLRFILERFKKYQKAAAILIVFGILLSSLYELRTYFKYQSVVFEQAFERRSDLQNMLERYRRVGKDYYRNHPLRPR